MFAVAEFEETESGLFPLVPIECVFRIEDEWFRVAGVQHFRIELFELGMIRRQDDQVDVLDRFPE